MAPPLDPALVVDPEGIWWDDAGDGGAAMPSTARSRSPFRLEWMMVLALERASLLTRGSPNLTQKEETPATARHS